MCFQHVDCGRVTSRHVRPPPVIIQKKQNQEPSCDIWIIEFSSLFLYCSLYKRQDDFIAYDTCATSRLTFVSPLELTEDQTWYY